MFDTETSRAQIKLQSTGAEVSIPTAPKIKTAWPRVLATRVACHAIHSARHSKKTNTGGW